MRAMVDWGAGNYERTAEELAPVAAAVVEMAALQPGEQVLDVACGTGNAALLAAARGARVVGIDGAPRLLEVARARARDQRVEVDFRHGDLLDLPVEDGLADVVLSVFGVIFAADPAQALRELARVTRANARIFLTAWIPAGPIDAMLTAMGRVLGEVTQSTPPRRFPWSEASAVRSLADAAALSLVGTTERELAIRASSPEAYVDAGREHPMALAARAALERAGAGPRAQMAMTAALREANEDPDGFLIHSPYVVHELRSG